MKKCIALVAALLLLMCGCAAPAPATVPTTVETTAATTAPTEPSLMGLRKGARLVILLPDEAEPAWKRAGEDLKARLEALSYPVQLQYAGADGEIQAQQLAQAIREGAAGIILAPVESATLTEVCQQAKEQKLPIFAYDRLLMDTDAVGYYVSFDYRQMGIAMGNHIVEALNLTEAESTHTVEFFMGSPEDSKALLLYQGIMEQLRPYLESGKLVAQSGRTAFEDTCVVDYDSKHVTQSLQEYLQTYYKKAVPDVLCTVSDDFAAACIAVLEENKCETLPLITGLGGTQTGEENLASGKQSFTASTDLLQLSDRLVQTVDAVLTGQTPELNDRESCYNNVCSVPAYLCEFTVQTQPSDPSGEATDPQQPTQPAKE